MELSKLHYFLSVCECGNFSAAARQLFTTRQAVSKAIHQIEMELDTALFVRRGNELSLTPDGKYLKTKAEVIFDELAEIKARFSQKRGEKGSLRVSMSLDAASILPKLDFESMQKFNVRLTEHSIKHCISDLELGAVDLCIMSCMQKEFPPYASQTICSDPLAFIVSRELFSTLGRDDKYMRISELSNFDILLLSDKEYVYANFLEKYRKLDQGDERLHTVSDQALMRRLVRSGTAVALAPSTYLQHLPEDLIGLRCLNRHLFWYVTAVYEKSLAEDPRIIGFVDYLRM